MATKMIRLTDLEVQLNAITAKIADLDSAHFSAKEKLVVELRTLTNQWRKHSAYIDRCNAANGSRYEIPF